MAAKLIGARGRSHVCHNRTGSAAWAGIQPCRSLGRDATEVFDPHLSLIYQKMPEAEQKRLAAEIQVPFSTVTFDRIAATRCRLPVATAADVAAWETITSRRLGR